MKPTEIKQVPKGKEKVGHLDAIYRMGNIFKFLAKNHIDLGKIFQFKMGDLSITSINCPRYLDDNIAEFYDKGVNYL